MAQRVGPAGRVTGIDVDAPLGAQALTMLHDAGHRQCWFAPHDITADEPLPGGSFDLVYARLLLFHLPERVAALRRLWDARPAGGHLGSSRTTTCAVSLLSPRLSRRRNAAA